MQNLKAEFVDNDEIFNIVNEIEEEDRNFKVLKKDYPEEIIKLEEALLIYKGENDFKILKTDFPDNNWKYLTKKLAYPYEYFNSIDD